MLLAMVAAPGTKWRGRFFVTKGKVIEAPVEGRSCIRRLGNFQLTRSDGTGFSPEGLEVLATYGYIFDRYDFDKATRKTLDHPRDLRMMSFLLSMEQRFQASRPLLTESLRDAVGGPAAGNYWPSFIRSPPCRELARMLLWAGADPNLAVWDWDRPALYYALKNRDEDMSLFYSSMAQIHQRSSTTA